MKKTVAVVLCGMLLLSMLAGCVEKDPLVGTWEGELDFSPMVNATMVSTGTNMEKYFTFTDLTVKVTMTFQEDKRCTLSIDRDGFDAMLEKLKSQVSTGIVGVLEDLLEGNGAEMTVQEYLDLSGMDLDMLIDSTLNVVITEQTLKELELEGLYQTEEGKLFPKVRAMLNMFPGSNKVVVYFADTQVRRGSTCALDERLLRELTELLEQPNVVVK